MFCANCGATILEGSAFCRSCGSNIGGEEAVTAPHDPSGGGYMSDRPLFQDSEAVVTSSMFVYQNNQYPLPSIKSVVFFKEPLDVTSLVINAVIALVGLVGILTFSTICVLVGLIAVGICGYNLYNDYIDITDPNYVVAVTPHVGESIYIKKRNMKWVRELHDALDTALRS